MRVRVLEPFSTGWDRHQPGDLVDLDLQTVRDLLRSGHVTDQLDEARYESIPVEDDDD